MKKILILGGGGYVGTQLEILLKNYNVTVYDIFYFNWLLRNKKKLKNSKRLTIKKRMYWMLLIRT